MTLSLEKCEFAKPEVKFVGHFVGSGGRRPDPDRLEGLDKMSRPYTKGNFGSFSVLSATTEITLSILLTSSSHLLISPVRRFLANYPANAA